MLRTPPMCRDFVVLDGSEALQMGSRSCDRGLLVLTNPEQHTRYTLASNIVPMLRGSRCWGFSTTTIHIRNRPWLLECLAFFQQPMSPGSPSRLVLPYTELKRQTRGSSSPLNVR